MLITLLYKKRTAIRVVQNTLQTVNNFKMRGVNNYARCQQSC